MAYNGVITSEVARSANELAKFFELDSQTKRDILAKYELMCASTLGSSDQSIISFNADIYRYLISDSIAYALYMDKNEEYFKEAMSANTLLEDAFESKHHLKIRVLEPIARMINVNRKSVVSLEATLERLMVFNTPIENPSNLSKEELRHNLDDTDLPDSTVADLFDDDTIDNSDFSDREDVHEFDDDDYIDDGLDDDETDDGYEEDEENYEDTPQVPPVEEAEAPDMFDNEGDLTEEEFTHYKKSWGGTIKLTLSGLYRALDDIYSSGYSGTGAPVGVLTEYGILKTFSHDGKINGAPKTDRAMDILTFKGLTKAIGGLSAAPNIEELNSNRLPTVLDIKDQKHHVFYGMHVRFIYGHFAACKGLRKLVRKKDPDAAKKAKVHKYGYMREYIHETIEKIFYLSYKASSIPPDEMAVVDDTIREQVNSINHMLAEAMMNVIVVTERRDGISTEMKVCTCTTLNPMQVVHTMSKNIPGEPKVEEIGKYVNNVLMLKLIIDADKANQSSLFAYEVMDGILESGEVPNWSHALLGKKIDGTSLFWDDFKVDNPSKRNYCIYAESRAGKGIMTSTLITNILANGYKLMYVDGKPENGVGTGKIAWSKGKEAAMYNGTNQRLAPYNDVFEAFTNGLRDPDTVYAESDKNIPDGIFPMRSQKQAFMELATFLRGLQIALEVIQYRAQQQLSSDDWIVFIFDELKKMTSIENSMRDIFDKVVLRAGLRANEDGPPPKTVKNESAYTPQIEWIASWYAWLDSLSQLVNSAATMAIGKANCNMFFIFQGSDWMQDTGDFGKTFLVKHLLAKLESTKIVGYQGISGKGGNAKYGNGISVKYSWNNFLSSNRGTWAITHQSSVDSCDSDEKVTIFKPFNVYLEDRMDNGKPDAIQERYLEPYVNKMLASLTPGVKAADVLEFAYNYLSDFVRMRGYGDSLNDIMYNAHDFGPLDFDMRSNSEGRFDESQIDFNDREEYSNNGGNFEFSDEDDEDDFLDFGTNSNTTPNLDTSKFGGQKQQQTKDEYEMLNRPMPVTPPQPAREQFDFGESNTPFRQKLNDWMHEEDGAQQGEQAFNFGEEVEIDEPLPMAAGAEEVLNMPPRPTFRYDMPDAQPIMTGFGADAAVNMDDSGRASTVFSFPTNMARELNDENSVRVDIPMDHVLERSGSRLFKTIWGTNYEFKKRLEMVLKSIHKKINKTMVTRLTMIGNSVVVNGRQVDMRGVLGGFENIELSNIIDMPTIMRFFPNIESMQIDCAILERIENEMTDLPESLFVLSKNGRFRKLEIMLPDGSKEVLNRGQVMSKAAERERQRADVRSRMDVSCAVLRGEKYGEASMGRTDKIWRSAKSLSSRGMSGAYQNLMKEKPSVLKATFFTLGGVAAITIGGAIFGLGKAFSLFSRRR